MVNNYAYYLAERGFTEKNPQVISALFADTQEQGRWLKANIKQAAQIIAPQQGLDVDVVEVSLRVGLAAGPKESLTLSAAHVAYMLAHVCHALLLLSLIC